MLEIDHVLQCSAALLLPRVCKEQCLQKGTSKITDKLFFSLEIHIY